MASYVKKMLTGLSDMFLGPATTNLFTDREKGGVNKYIDSLGDDYEVDTIKFDKEGNPEYSIKKKKKKEKNVDTDKLIKEALLFDEKAKEVGQQMGMPQSVQGIPMAGGGAVVPSQAGGDYNPSALQNIEIPNYADKVRSALLEKTQPGISKDQATRNVFGNQNKSIPSELEDQIAAIFSAGNETEDPRMQLKKLVPLYSGNKEALDRLKLLISLYPEE